MRGAVRAPKGPNGMGQPCCKAAAKRDVRRSGGLGPICKSIYSKRIKECKLGSATPPYIKAQFRPQITVQKWR